LPKTWSGGLSVSIGKPISNTQVYVLDANLAPVPLGVPGELYIGGDGLAREYLNRPTLTAERFIPNPFDRNTLPGRLYRTGDLVRWLGDGNLEFLGRTDEQVKVRGFRVELGEVEAALRTHPSVSEAAVITREDKSGSKHLIAYVAPHSGAAVDRGELRSWLEQKLPAYMLPAHYVALAELPLTANGKVDRRALPTPESLSVATTRAITAPRNALEKRLLEIWSELLERNHLSVEDNFFHLGGHSLLATQLVSRIGIVFGIELPVRCVFENPSIAGLSAAIQGRQSASGLETTRISRRLDAARAEELLAHLDQLSEAEMEQLLNSPELKQVTS
jgi:hypothetical protein